MKKIIGIIAALTITFSGLSQFSKASLLASGLTCSLCSKAVKEALEEVPYVQEVNVDLKSQEYNIEFKKEATINFDALKTAVEDAGFSVASLKVTGIFSGIQIQKDKHFQIDGKYFHFLNGNNQELNGERTITIVDKNFLPSKEFKKQSSSSKMECVQTGKAGSCCTKEGISADARIYHVII